MENLIYILLALTSVTTLAFIVERGIALRWTKVIPPELETAVDECRAPADVPKLRRACERAPSPLGRLLLVAADQLESSKADAEDAIQTRARHEIVRLERGLVVLEVVVGIAPLMGLVGTIYGMMTLFGNLGQSGLSDNAALAKGIAVILNSTLMGLLIAMIGLDPIGGFQRFTFGL
ncbi:MAG: MotA/TolQ/ExbB proton channel family protein, partial [Verrucomicrobia bacterium]|nr:MotA/TolQ/ExbB proton channel family protein [Verrucomicrobiota bacterium]